jgi:uncharacterized protein YbaR (Trm112 family)
MRFEPTLNLEPRTSYLVLMPPITAEALKWLVCPVCHSALALDAEAVLCSGCGRRYPIVDGIPILLAARTS